VVAPRSMAQMKKGFLKLFILANLYEQPLHGYAIIKRISDRSEGFWSPKAGNIYPLISSMVDEGLLRQVASAPRRKSYELTEEGKVELLHLLGEAEEAIVHLVRAMNRNNGLWIKMHMELLEEISPSNRKEKMSSLLSTLDSLSETLARTRRMFEEEGAAPPKHHGSRR